MHWHESAMGARVSPHPELHAKYLKTKKWQWSSRWLYWRKGTPSQFYIWHMKESLHRTVFRKWSWDKTEKQLLSPSAGQKDWMWPTEKGVFYNSLLCQWLLPGPHPLVTCAEVYRTSCISEHLGGTGSWCSRNSKANTNVANGKMAFFFRAE